jgi:hypothetical protein
MNAHRLIVLISVALAGARIGAAQQATQNPHGKLQEACAVCHSPEGWTPAHVSAAFDHAKKGFALAGAHARTSCRGCHTNLTFTGTRTDCAACHADVHRGELGADCARCHTARSFLDRAIMVPAHQLTRFPLAGAHRALDCEACHTPTAQGRMAFVNLPVQCVACHLTQYQAAKNPDHVAGAFPQDCAQCHAPSVWTNARFNHDASGFPLTGAHRAVACKDCHGTGTFANVSPQCVGCHQPDYNGATNPNHASAGFTTDCIVCHTTTTWMSFDHAKTAFPLTGAHGTVACQQCHGDGVYAGKSTTCVSCHQTDYNATTNPAHAGAGFPTSCEACHTTAAWTGATFNHTWFPLPHRTATCADCHTNPGNYTVFVCTNCHTQTETAGHHSGVSGYVWDSQHCYACHRNGGGG